MAISPHLRRIFSGNRRNSCPYLLLNQFSHRLLSTTSDQPKPSSLSARMSFVFDQIDAIEKEREQKDQALQRIRTWRNNRATNEVAAAAAAAEKEKEKDNSDSASVGLGLNLSEVVSVTAEAKNETKGGGFLTREVELVHPWPEWIELMERLVHLNYFDCRRKDEDKLIADSGFQIAEIAEEALDFTRDFKTVQTACLNFGKDRFDILKPLSRQDIQVLVGFGCPSTDKKVVFSAKLLRKLVHLDEGDVCSSCSLRSTCERAYLLTNKEDEARTIDIMRVLLTYGFNPINGSVVNDSLMKIKRVKAVVRKLLHEVVKLSAVPIDPNLPPPVIKKPPPKVKQAPPPPRKRVGRDDVEMKKGDWLCPKCEFMNFAKNTVCLQCDAKRPKRQLLPGEWECPECNFLNYRRNMACFHCECERPADEFTENQMQERQRGPSARLENLPSRKEVSDAWNFDFDDNESDGADVAAFEYADSRKVGEDFPPGRQGHEENIRGFEDGFYKNSRPAGVNDREYSGHAFQKPGVGFDDFEDEEDDIESYELDTSHNSNQVQRNSSINLSDLDVDSESEDSEATSENLNARPRFSSSRYNKASEPHRRKAAFSGSEDSELDFDSDKDLPVHPKWKSSHVASSRQRTRGGMEFGSEEDYELSSGDEEFPSRQNKGKGREGSTTGLGRRGRHQEIEDDISNFESDEEGGRFNRERSRGNKVFPDRRNSGNGRGERRGGFDFSEDARPVSRGMMGGERRNSFEDKFNHGGNNHNRGFRGDDFNGRSSRRNAGGETDARNSRGHRRENFANKQSGRFSKRSGDGSTPDSYLEDERYSRPRINVR